MNQYAPLPTLDHHQTEDDHVEGPLPIYSDARNMPASPSSVGSCFTEGEEPMCSEYTGRASFAEVSQIRTVPTFFVLLPESFVVLSSSK